MRIIITFVILMIGLNMYAQTDSIENSVLYKKASAMEITGEEFSKTVKNWNVTIKKINGYPNLPINNNGKVQYSFVRDFPGLSKGELFNRILEWFSITYGIVPAYLYSNLEDGKIICSNSLKIYNNTTSSFTYIISIRDKRILMNIANLGYQETHAGYYSDDTWIPESSNFYGIDQVFPIILKEPSKWNYYLNILATINKQMNNEIYSLTDYLINYDSRYVF
ncbi:MAG: DUF4468 domain-containing protein [Paludibacter sp.]|nr:DUF4468 domain-containing protein [Paludibacter sp.]